MSATTEDFIAECIAARDKLKHIRDDHAGDLPCDQAEALDKGLVAVKDSIDDAQRAALSRIRELRGALVAALSATDQSARQYVPVRERAMAALDSGVLGENVTCCRHGSRCKAPEGICCGCEAGACPLGGM